MQIEDPTDNRSAVREGDRWLSAGLFLTTLATLLLELLDSRLLSVLTWYHLSFLAVSLAMLGGAAGAVVVFLAGDRLSGEAARRNLARAPLLLALAIPATHGLLMRIQIPPLMQVRWEEVAPLALATVLLTIPFLLSGAVVTLALTRCGGRIGVLYGSDLLGAALGCLLIVPVLFAMDMLSAGLVAGALVAAAACCYARFAGTGVALPAALAVGLTAVSLGHVAAGAPIGVAHPRGGDLDPAQVSLLRWNAYSHITVLNPTAGQPFYWGRGKSPPDLVVASSIMRIDGAAGTPITEWDGRRESLSWVQYDVTTLPYHLRTGRVAIVGVGGGRDVLSAIWGGSQQITGIELNEIFVDLLSRRYRDFANIVGHEGVRIVNDEGRSFLSRTGERYDVLQMSLVDTWAATGAGAFTLTENALYTVEAWKTFLSRLAPGGLFSTSRWFSPRNVSETSRLLTLCVTALLELGVDEPARHIALVSRHKVATLLVSMQPLAADDIAKIRGVAQRYDFEIAVLPGNPIADERLAGIVSATTVDELAVATYDPNYDYTAPTDGRPYFFNMLRPASFYKLAGLESGDIFLGTGGVVWGNIRATETLIVLLLIAIGLSAAIIFVPLLLSGLPRMDASSFGLALAYFAIIGYGFMSIQIPLLQRFSVLLGHPIYTYSVILFGMILLAGLGSFASERLDPLGRWRTVVPVAIAGLVGVLTLTVQPIIESSLLLPLPARAAVVLACIAPTSFLLGFCFPLGLRLVGALSTTATAWMWGVNGACGVLASIVTVLISMWVGIHANLVVAAALYLLLTVPARGLARRCVALRA
jgi:hypothetical protein